MQCIDMNICATYLLSALINLVIQPDPLRLWEQDTSFEGSIVKYYLMIGLIDLFDTVQYLSGTL